MNLQTVFLTTLLLLQAAFAQICPAFSDVRSGTRCIGGPGSKYTNFGDGISREQCQQRCQSLGVEGCCESFSRSLFGTTLETCRFWEGGSTAWDFSPHIKAAMCTAYTCKSCSNGTMDSQSKCSGNHRDNCKSCNAGYYLSNKQCVAYSCKSSCPNGTMDSQSKCSGNHRFNCKSCNAGYYLYNKQCVAYTCKSCSNGITDSQSKCSGNDKHNCKSCNAGYYLTYFHTGFSNKQCVAFPTVSPTTALPTAFPTVSPTTALPTAFPTVSPTTALPTAFPTVSPTTALPTAFPTDSPTTAMPTTFPTVSPTPKPSAQPTMEPSVQPTAIPTAEPTLKPSAQPTMKPSAQPTVEPTTCDWLYDRVTELAKEVAELRLENRALKTRLATPVSQTCDCDSAATKAPEGSNPGTNPGTNMNPAKGCPVYATAKDCKKKSKKNGLKCVWNKNKKLCTKKTKNKNKDE